MDERAGGRKRFWGQLNNSKVKTIKEMDLMFNRTHWVSLLETHGRAIEYLSLTPTSSPSPQTGSRKISLSNFRQLVWDRLNCQSGA